MTIAVWDTYVDRLDGRTMHFDILVEENEPFDTVRRHGVAYLQDKPVETASLTTEACRFCHVEQASPAVEQAIEDKGYAIVELDHCE
jgi:hypothetical protein